ncbi:MAG: CNNM domain-containing protein, partial [Acidimicrobiia bacterium]
MSPTQIVDVVVLGVCILASGFFSGSETALVAVPRERIPQLRASRKGRQLEELVTD